MKIRKSFKDMKLEIIKKYLKDSGISFDYGVSDLKKLKSSLRSSLGDIEYKNASNIIEGVSENFDELLVDLETNTKGAIDKFVDKVSRVSRPLSKATIHSLASRTALILAPTLTSKLAVGALVTGKSIYKLSKNKKQGIIVDQEYEANRILQELELVRDEDGQIVDTRFSKRIQKLIREYLRDNEIEFIDFGYLSLRDVIYKLSLEKKKELCHIINNNTGNKIDVNGRFLRAKGTFFDDLKSTTKKVSASTAAGIGTAGVINSVDPAIIAAPLNAVCTTGLADEYVISQIITDESAKRAANFITSIAGTTAGALAENLPFVGEYVENIYAIENLVVGGVLGLGVGVVGGVLASAVGVVKGLHHKFDTQRDRKAILEYDSKKYGTENLEEMKRIRSSLESKKTTLEEQAIIDLGYNLMKDMRIKLDDKPKNMYEFKKVVLGLSGSKRKELSNFFSKIRNYNGNDHSDFVNSVIKTKDVLSTLVLVSLSGLSVYDLLNDGEFLPSLSSELFSDVSGNIYLQLPEKIQIERIEREGLTDSISQFGDNFSGNVDAVISGDKSLSEAVSDVLDGSSEVATSSDDLISQFLSIEDLDDTKRIYKYLEGMQVEEKKELFGLEISSKMVPNKERITTFIEGMQEDNLIDLAYYYNSCVDIDKSTDISLVIGEVLKNNLGVIQEGIESYNEKMTVINGVSSGLEVVVPVIDGVSEVSYTKQKKM